MGAMQSLQCSAHWREPCKLSSSHEAENQFEWQKNYKNLKKKNLKEIFFFRVYMAMWPLLRIKTSSSRAGERCYTLRLESTVACQLFTVNWLLSTVYCLLSRSCQGLTSGHTSHPRSILHTVFGARKQQIQGLVTSVTPRRLCGERNALCTSMCASSWKKSPNKQHVSGK